MIATEDVGQHTEVQAFVSDEHSSSDGQDPEASRRARVAPRPEATRGRLAPEHRAKLASSALDDNQIEALGWSTGINGRLQIPYLKPDGTREHCRDGKPFIRERLTAAEIKADPKGGKYRSPKGNGCRIYHSKLAIAAPAMESRSQENCDLDRLPIPCFRALP